MDEDLSVCVLFYQLIQGAATHSEQLHGHRVEERHVLGARNRESIGAKVIDHRRDGVEALVTGCAQRELLQLVIEEDANVHIAAQTPLGRVDKFL